MSFTPLLDAAAICTVAFQMEGVVHAIPTCHWRDGEHLYIHGAKASRMLKALTDGEVCITIALADALVLAFGHESFNELSVGRSGPCVIKRLRGCGSGNEYVAITPDGDIYPCHQFVGHEEYRMGSLEDGTFNEEIKKEFAGAHVYSKPWPLCQRAKTRHPPRYHFRLVEQGHSVLPLWPR